jgi:hypothetical protein
MFEHNEAGEIKTPSKRRSLPFYSSIVVGLSALGLYLLLALFVWAAPQPSQSAVSEPIHWLDSTPSSSIADSQNQVVYLPVVKRQVTPTPPPTPTPIPFVPIPGASYSSIPVDPYFWDGRIDYQHPDLNLEMRGWIQVSEYCGLWTYNTGTTDVDGPRLAELFQPARLPTINATYRVYSWNWDTGRVGDPIYRTEAIVTLIKMQTNTDEIIHLPGRSANIYINSGKTYYAQVLYATDNQITFVYTRDGNVIRGYTVHITNIWVDPLLVARYQADNAAGRHQLPALEQNQAFGRAKAGGILVAICDNGSFMDPRSRRDWWPGW